MFLKRWMRNQDHVVNQDQNKQKQTTHSYTKPLQSDQYNRQHLKGKHDQLILLLSTLHLDMAKDTLPVLVQLILWFRRLVELGHTSCPFESSTKINLYEMQVWQWYSFSSWMIFSFQVSFLGSNCDASRLNDGGADGWWWMMMVTHSHLEGKYQYI